MITLKLLGLVGILTVPADVSADTGDVTTTPIETAVKSQAEAKSASESTSVSTKSETKAKRKRVQAPERPVPFAERHKRELLGLVGLLILWLITRIMGQEETTVRRPSKRHSPLNAEEFARVIFAIVRGENVAEYRGLYLTGSEATQVMGDQNAKMYLEQRTPEVFELAFDSLYDRVPANASFERGHLTEHDVIELWVVDNEQRRHCITVGQIAHVGAILRLIAPAVGPEETPTVGFMNKQPRV